MYYKNTPIEIKQQRWDKIGNARRKEFTEEEIIRIEDVLSWNYVADATLILKHANIIDKSKKILENYWVKKLITKPKVLYVPYKIQEFSYDKFQNLIRDSKSLNHKKIEEKYNISSKSYKELTKKIPGLYWKSIENPSLKETKPEQFVREHLEKLNIFFEKEIYVNNNKFRLDYLIGIKVIEVQGDYYHANPRIYNYETQLNAMQKRNILRDVVKKQWLLNNDYQLLEIWEKDIKENPEKVKQLINNNL